MLIYAFGRADGWFREISEQWPGKSNLSSSLAPGPVSAAPPSSQPAHPSPRVILLHTQPRAQEGLVQLRRAYF